MEYLSCIVGAKFMFAANFIKIFLDKRKICA